MPNIINLKFKGNKSFVDFSNLTDTEALTQTWKVCTKVASYLENGQRLENLSWRLWHLQNLLLDTDNAKSKRDFKRLPKCMGGNKEKGRSIEELEAPDYGYSHSAEYTRQNTAEKECSRDASHNAKSGTIERMQSIDHPDPATNQPVEKPDSRPRVLHFKYDYAELMKRMHSTTSARNTTTTHSDDTTTAAGESNGKNPSANPAATKLVSQSFRFPPLFSNDFGPSALLYSTPTVTNSMNHGEDLTLSSTSNDGFSVHRPTIELPLDEILNNVEGTAVFPCAVDHPNTAPVITPVSPVSYTTRSTSPLQQQQENVFNQIYNIAPSLTVTPQPQTMTWTGTEGFAIERHENDRAATDSFGNNFLSSQRKEGSEFFNAVSQVNQESPSEIVDPSKVNLLLGSAHSDYLYSVSPRSSLTVTSRSTVCTSGPGATATSDMTQSSNIGNDLAPPGVKAECSNCGATRTPLWRRGLDNELNCNACGLYYKLHKCPRPKTMRNYHGEGRVQVSPRQETGDVMTQCYNCHTTATPLWRKDDEGNTVCNACGLYYKSHGSHRPVSMKSDLKRKRSRHESSRGNPSEMPSASPGVSRSPSFVHNHNNSENISDVGITMSSRSPKRRDMSASDPPSSPASYSPLITPPLPRL